MKLRIALLITALAFFAVCVIRADDGTKQVFYTAYSDYDPGLDGGRGVLTGYEATIEAEDNKPTPRPAPIVITDDATKQSIQQAYQNVVMANKDFQIALLQARVKYHVDETWRVDLATLTFSPPPEEKATVGNTTIQPSNPPAAKP